MSNWRFPRVSDGQIALVPTLARELPIIAALEREVSEFVTAESIEVHRARLAQSDVVYRSVLTQQNKLVGFIMLRLDPDGVRVELRRIVVERGAGHGKRAMALVERVCVEQLNRHHIWLDVFDFNPRARRVYERAGYRVYGDTVYEGGQRALLMDKVLDA